MSSLIKTFAAARQGFVNLAASVLIISGGALLIGGCAYRVFVRPDLTSQEAIDALWPFFLAGVVTLLAGWLVDRAEGLPRG